LFFFLREAKFDGLQPELERIHQDYWNKSPKTLNAPLVEQMDPWLPVKLGN
jgi:hypothetical protein